MALSFVVLSEVMQSRSFRRQYFARTLSVLGTTMSYLALTFAILGSGGSTTELGLVMAANTLPMILLLLFGGVWGDRYPRNRIMAVADMVRVVTQGLLAAAVLTHHMDLWLMIPTQIASGAAAGVFQPASSGLTRVTANPKRMQESISLLSTSCNTLAAVGSLVAAGLVATVGAGWCIAFEAGTFLLSAVLCRGIPLPPRPPRAVKNQMVRELAEGWREVRTRNWLWISLAGFTVWQLAFGSYTVLGPDVAEKALGGATVWALILTVYSLGNAAGGIVGMRWKPARLLVLARLAELMEIPVFVLLALRAPLALIVAAAFVAGTFESISDVLWRVAMQEQVPEESLSRVSSYEWLGTMGVQPLALVLAAVLSSVFGPAAMLAGSGALIGLAAMSGLLSPDIRRMRRLPEEPDEDESQESQESNDAREIQEVQEV